MSNSKLSILTTCAMLGVLFCGTTIADGKSDDPKEVVVMNTEAEPVPVAIQGTINVDVQGTQYVSIANTVVDPVPTYNVDATHPDYTQKVVNISGLIPANESLATWTLYTVPAGKQFVVQQINIAALTSENVDLTVFFNFPHRFWLPPAPIGVNSYAQLPNRHTWLLPFRYVVSSGSPINIFFSLTNGGNTAQSGVQGNLVGYLIDN